MFANSNKIEVQNLNVKSNKNTIIDSKMWKNIDKENTENRKIYKNSQKSKTSISTIQSKSKSKRPRNLVTMGKINEYNNAKNKKKYNDMTEVIAVLTNDEPLETELVPYLFLLLVDFKVIKQKFPIKHDPKKNNTSIENGEQLAIFNNSKRSYITKLAYQQILETTYGGMSGKSVENLKKFLTRNGSSNKEVSLKSFDVGSIVSHLSLIEPLARPFSIDKLRHILSMFNDDGGW